MADGVKMALSDGSFTVVDEDDYEWLKQWKWKRQPQGYVARSGWREGKWITILMHRLIANTPDGLETDHINGNKLDNRKANLRNVPHALNERNKPLNPRNASGYRGVSWDKSRQKWVAQTKHEGKHIWLGRYNTAEEASAVYERWIEANVPDVTPPVMQILVSRCMAALA